VARDPSGVRVRVGEVVYRAEKRIPGGATGQACAHSLSQTVSQTVSVKTRVGRPSPFWFQMKKAHAAS
jgi:hypothetical protein